VSALLTEDSAERLELPKVKKEHTARPVPRTFLRSGALYANLRNWQAFLPHPGALGNQAWGPSANRKQTTHSANRTQPGDQA
jgi:hypothetical protein